MYSLKSTQQSLNILLFLYQFTDKNVFLGQLAPQSLICYSDTACTQNPDKQNNPIGVINDCCGFVVNAASYRVNSESCSPCK